MIENLRAKPVKKNELANGVFQIKKNTPKQIDKTHNFHIAHIHEDAENEDVYIQSTFNDDSFALICNEFYLNFIESPKRVDISYYYFSENNKVNIYLYDMKKTFAGIDDMISLVEQWKSSIVDAEYCIRKLEQYEIINICLGVITEDNATERRIRELNDILQPEEVESIKIPDFMKRQRRADTTHILAMRKILIGFDAGEVTIHGHTYKYDIREFVNKKHDMLFSDGILKEQVALS